MLINILEKNQFSLFFMLSCISFPKVKNSEGMFLFDKIIFNRLSKCFCKTLQYEITIFLQVGFCVCVVAGKKQCSVLKCRRKNVSKKHGEIKDNTKLFTVLY